MTDLDPKLTFDSFVVGPANRLANAAARRAAESPGASYNPLFVYSASGLGKSHILTAVAHHGLKADRHRDVRYLTLEHYLEELAGALERGDRDGFREEYAALDILLLDDVQFLAGQPEAQEMLLRTLDQLSTAGGQTVLASDRPPADIDGLDARLLSRFSGGLIVDIAPPEYETRVAIIRRKAEERGQELQPGVAEGIARSPVRNVRELGGALNKVFATQELEGRPVSAQEVAALLGDEPPAPDEAPRMDEFGSFLSELAASVAETVDAQEEAWRRAFREKVVAAQREGFTADRLEVYQAGEEPEGWQEILDRFDRDLRRLREIDAELDRLDNPWPEAAAGLLRDPDRLDEAETLLTSVRERQRPFPRLADGPVLEELEGFPGIVLKAAQQLVDADRPEYNPLYLWSDPPERARTLLGAAGRSYGAAHPAARMAVTSVVDFAEDFIRALGEGVAGAWRERWWTVDLLLVHGVEALSGTERAQDEFFHLFEALKRRGARVLLVADRAPSGIDRIDERLRSRFEGGLVLEVEAGAGSGELHLVEPDPVPATLEAAPFWDDGGSDPASEPAPRATAHAVADGPAPEEATVDTLLREHEGRAARRAEAAAEDTPAPADDVAGGAMAGAPEPGWFPSGETVVLHWPRLEHLLVEELD